MQLFCAPLLDNETGESSMNTRILMAASALFLGLLGLAASFLPQEILVELGAEPRPHVVTLLRLAGAAMVGFALLNWSARGILIGGIYARPVALGNFLHFGAGAMTMIDTIGTQPPPGLVFALTGYGAFAIGFGIVLFRPPVARRAGEHGR